MHATVGLGAPESPLHSGALTYRYCVLLNIRRPERAVLLVDQVLNLDRKEGWSLIISKVPDNDLYAYGS